MSFKNSDGIYVNRSYLECDRYSFEGTAENVKNYIDSVVANAKDKGMVNEGYFDINMTSGQFDRYELKIIYEFERVENEKERANREVAEAKVKAAASAKRKAAAEKKKLKADAEYAEFLRLKQKFGEL